MVSSALPAVHKMATPRIADAIEAANTAILAAAKSVSTGNAWLAINSDMVKPIPASAPAPINCRHEYSSGLVAIPSHTAIADADTNPRGLPITNPTIIASMRGSWPVNASGVTATPALARANSGSTT